MVKRTWMVGLVALGLALAAGAPVRAASTLDNLQAAYNGESNARLKYIAYAKKADAEGYQRVAQLFRAAARAEGIHASNHSAVIHKMGAVAVNKIETPTPKSTLENLRDAVKGETYERDVMYPGFIKKADQDDNGAAAMTFDQAKAAEAEHARLYQMAVDNLAQWKVAGEGFWVCPVCGFTNEKLPAKECPVCTTEKEKFMLVS